MKIWVITDTHFGRKVLVFGNHDQASFGWYLRNGFDFCCESFVLKHHGLNILFSHEPLLSGEFDLNIHGHLHLGRHREYETDHRHFLVSLEEMGYSPHSLKYIVEQWQKGGGAQGGSEMPGSPKPGSPKSDSEMPGSPKPGSPKSDSEMPGAPKPDSGKPD